MKELDEMTDREVELSGICLGVGAAGAMGFLMGYLFVALHLSRYLLHSYGWAGAGAGVMLSSVPALLASAALYVYVNR